MDSSHQKVVEYDPSWVSKYESEVEKLKPIFGSSFLSIEHIGSTSVLGLASKPIIDIAVLISSHLDASNFIAPLGKEGYVFDENVYVNTEHPERHFFRKGKPTEFHLSVAYADKGGFWLRQLLFRDYLRSHPEARDEYAKLKRELIEKDPTGGDMYISGKTELISNILKKAGFTGNKAVNTQN